MQRVFAIVLCLAACGACTASRKEVPDKDLSDEAFLAKLGAQEKASDLASKDKQKTFESTAPQVKVTTATFEPVYRAAKTVQGATQSGVSYVKFGELMQGFSTELGIAKDHELTASDKKLLALYQQVFDAYQFSKVLWEAKMKDLTDKDAPIPVITFSSQDVAYYRLHVVKSIPVPGYPDLNYVAAESMLTVWQQAEVLLTGAAAVYLGKQAPST
jgi:hypothetical protein